MSEAKAVVEGLKAGFTVRAIIISIILSIIEIFPNIATWWGFGITVEPVFAGRVGAPMYPPYGLVFILVLVAAMLKCLTPQEIVVITSTCWIVADAPLVLGYFIEPILTASYLPTTNPDAAKLLRFYPPLWTPGDASLVSPAWTGGAAVPIGKLFPYLAFWIIMLILWGLILVFQAALIRLQLVKKERLAFPLAIPVNEMLLQLEKGTVTQYVKKPSFLIAMAVGGIVGGLGAANYIWKFTTVYMAFGQFYQQWLHDLLKAISRETILYAWWMLIPPDIARFYLAPLDILVSISIWLLILQILLPIVLVNTGVITPGTDPSWTGPFPWSWFCYFWIPVALGLWTVVFGYKTYAETIKKKEEGADLPNQFVWMGFAGIWLIWIILWVVFGASILPLLIGFITWFLYTTGMVAVCGLTGLWVGGADVYPALWLAWKSGTAIGLFPASGAAANTQSAWATTAGVVMTSTMMGQLQQGSCSAWAFTTTYAMSEPAKIKERDIFNSHVLAILITAVIGMPIGLYIIYGTGASRMKVWGVSMAQTINLQIPYVVKDAAPPAEFNWQMFLLSVVLVGILFFLRSRFAWFFFVPYATYFWFGMWLLNAGIALILKVITLKVFGVKAYEEVGVPAAVGFLVGVTLLATIIMGANSVTGGISIGM